MNLNQALLNRMLLEVWRVALVFGLACVIAVGASSQPATNQPTTTANNFLEVPVKPVAIGHHGVGPNLGSDRLFRLKTRWIRSGWPIAWVRGWSKSTCSLQQTASWQCSTTISWTTLRVSIR